MAALEKCTVRNPILLNEKRNLEKGKSFQTQQGLCLYCAKPDYRSADCKSVKTVIECWEILMDKKICFKSTGVKHRAAHYRSRTYSNCRNTPYKLSKNNSAPMLATTESTVIYPVVIIKVDGVKCRSLLDTVSRSSYASESLIDLLKINPFKKEDKTIETLAISTIKNLKIYDVEVESLDQTFSFQAEINKLERNSYYIIKSKIH